MTTIDYFAKTLKDCKAALFDVDDTLVRGSVSSGICKCYLEQEWQKGNYRNVLTGVAGDVSSLFYNIIWDEQHGFEAFANALNSAGCVDRESAYRFAERYVRKHGIPGASEFVACLKGAGLTAIAYTGGLDVSAKAAAKEFGLDASFGNYTIKGTHITLSRLAGEKRGKLGLAEKALSERGLNLDHCLVVGNGETDRHIMERARLSVAAPGASKQVMKRADWYEEVDYTALARSLDWAIKNPPKRW